MQPPRNDVRTETATEPDAGVGLMLFVLLALTVVAIVAL